MNYVRSNLGSCPSRVWYNFAVIMVVIVWLSAPTTTWAEGYCLNQFSQDLRCCNDLYSACFETFGQTDPINAEYCWEVLINCRDIASASYRECIDSQIGSSLYRSFGDLRGDSPSDAYFLGKQVPESGAAVGGMQLVFP